MKTRKITLLAVAFVLFGVHTIKAGGPTETDQVTLNIKLHPIQTLIVNSGQKTVDLEYKSKDDYSSGVSMELSDHLNFYSTGAFDINVKSSGETLNGTEDKIPVIDVTIIATKGGDGIDATYNTIELSNSDQPLVESGTGGVNKNINVKYEAKGNNEYVNLYRSEENPTVFTTTVTYSIVAK